MRPRARGTVLQCAGPRCPSEVHAEGYRKGAQENGRGPGPGGPGPRGRGLCAERHPIGAGAQGSVRAEVVRPVRPRVLGRGRDLRHRRGPAAPVRLPVPTPEEPEPSHPRAGPRQHPARDRVDDPADADPRGRGGPHDRDDLGPGGQTDGRRARGERPRAPVVVGVRLPGPADPDRERAAHPHGAPRLPDPVRGGVRVRDARPEPGRPARAERVSDGPAGRPAAGRDRRRGDPLLLGAGARGHPGRRART